MSMFDFEQIKELISSIDKSSVTSFEIKDANGEKLIIKKETEKEITTVQAVPAIVPPAVPAVQPTVAAAPAAAAEPAAAEQEDFKVITSPMVGVFYSAPSPDANPYVSVGQSVSAGDVVCIIEAMKLMNEVPATEGGVVAEICVQNGDVVEYGQPLFKLK